MSENKKGILLRKVQLYWASIREPKKNDEGKSKYIADVCNLDKKQAKALHDAGVEVKRGDKLKTPQPEKGLFITARSGLQPRVVDVHNQKLDGEEVPEIGNETLANVYIKPYEWEYMGKSGVSPGLNGIQILELVTYESDADVFGPEPEYATASVEETDDVPF